MVTKIEDIMDEFPFLPYKKPIKEKEVKLINQRKICNNCKYNKIYKYITEEPISLNEIYKKSNMEIGEINNILLILELEGYIEKQVGGYTCILDKK